MRLHSQVDLITNSSTELYTFPVNGAVEKAKKYLLDYIEDGTRVEDSFDIGLYITDDSIDDAMSDYEVFLGEDFFPEIDGEDWEATEKRWNSIPEEIRVANVVEYLLEQVDNFNDDGCRPAHMLKISILPGAKLKSPLDVVDFVNRFVVTMECYC